MQKPKAAGSAARLLLKFYRIMAADKMSCCRKRGQSSKPMAFARYDLRKKIGDSSNSWKVMEVGVND